MISAIIINFHTRPLLEELIPDLLAEADMDQIIVVNNSPLERLKDLKKKHPKIKVLTNLTNVGFARAVNKAVQKFPSDYYLLLNPDCRTSKGFLKHLLVAAQEQQAAAVGPRYFWDEAKTFRMPPAPGYAYSQLSQHQLVQQVALEEALYREQLKQNHYFFWQQTRPFTQPFLSGACLLVHYAHPFFKGDEILDPRFFMYYEDTDLCARLLAAGYPPVVAPKAEVIHFWDQSPSAKKEAYSEKSRQAYLEKHYGAEPVAYQGRRSPKTAPRPPEKIKPQGNGLPLYYPLKAEKYYLQISTLANFALFMERTVLNSKDLVLGPELLQKVKTQCLYFRLLGPQHETLKIWEWKNG